MNELNHNVAEQPVQCPASPVASRAMLGSEEAGLCILGCQGNKDEAGWAGVVSAISPGDVQCVRAGAGWELQGAKAVTVGLGMRAIPPCTSCSAAAQGKPARRQRGGRHFFHQ